MIKEIKEKKKVTIFNDSILNFLYIVDNFPPNGRQSGIRAYEFSKRLIDERIYPIVLTQRNEENTQIISTDLEKAQILSKIEVYRTKSFNYNNKILDYLLKYFLKLNTYLHWIQYAYFKGKKILKKNKNIKFIYASSPHTNCIIAAYLLKKKFNLPLIIEYRDPWSFNPYAHKNWFWLNKKIDLYLEKKILKSANLIITVSHPLIQFLRNYFPFLRNKPMFSISSGLTLIPNERNKEKKKDIVLTFVGSLYAKRDIVPLFKLISLLKKEGFFNNLNFRMNVFGIFDEKRLHHIVNILNVEDLIHIGSFILRTEAFKKVFNSDLAVHIGGNIPYPTLAFKVWDYLSCGKKILFFGLKESYTAEFLKKNQLGFIIPIEDSNEGKETLKKILTDLKNDKIKTTIELDKLNEFSWDEKAKEFLNYVIKPFSFIKSS